MTSITQKSLSLLMVFALVSSAFVGFAGTAAADHSNSEWDDAINDGDLQWQGQTLYTDTFDADTTVELRDSEDDSLVRQMEVDSAGELVFDTENLAANSYYIEGISGGADATESFELVEQSFDSSADAEEVLNDEQAGETSVNFEFDSNRASYDLIVSVDQYDAADDIAAALGYGAVENEADLSTHVDEDGNEHLVIADAPDTLTADFHNEEAGDYAFEFTVDDTGLTAAESVAVKEPGTGEGDFTQSVYTEEVGDLAEFTVQLENTNSATVTIGDADSQGYEYTFDVVDNDDDGEVTVEFNTWEAGQNDATDNVVSAAGDEDAIQNRQAETEIPDGYQLATGTYDLSVQMSDDRETDVAALMLSERSTDAASSHILPRDTDVSEVSDLESATERATVANEDIIVFEFEASGIYAKLDDSNTAGDLAADSQFAADNGIHVTIEETEAGPNQEPQSVAVSVGDLLVDEENDRFFLVYDSSDLAIDNEYEAAFHVTADNPYVEDEDAEEEVSQVFNVEERDLTIENANDDGVLEFGADANAQLIAETNVAPGTQDGVVARMTGDNPFLKSQDVEVTEDGLIEAAFDFSETDNGDEFTVEIRGLMDEPADAVIVANAAEEEEEEEETQTVDLSVSVTDENGEPVDADVYLAGDLQVAENGIATFSELEAGDYPVDVDAEGYQSASDVVSISEDAEGEVQFDITLTAEEPEEEPEEGEGEGEGESEEGEGEGEEPEQTEEPEETTEEPEENEDDEGPGQPGFGVVVALVALLGAALIAGRR